MMPYLRQFRLFFTAITLLVLATKPSAAQVGWKWGAAGTGNTESYNVTVDGSSNSFVSLTSNQDSTRFGTIAVYDSVFIAGSAQAIIAKADSSGHFQWAIGTQHSIAEPAGMATDWAGNLYLLGLYDSGRCAIGPYLLTNSFTAPPFGYYCMYFLAKISPAGGVLWAENVAPSVNMMGMLPPFGDNGGIGVDSSDHVYVTGVFHLPSITIGTTVLDDVGSGTEMFVAKYDSSGNNIWAEKFGNAAGTYPVSISVCNSGNFYISGNYTGTLTFGTTTLIDSNNFLTKFDKDGNPIWANSLATTFSTSGIAADPYENIYLTGQFGTTGTIGPDLLVSEGLEDVFVAKLDSSGTALWGVSAGGTEADRGYGIAVDAYGDSWICGSMGSLGYAYSMNFSGHILNDPPDTSTDVMFVAEYDNCGKYITSMALRSGGDDQSAIAVDNRDNVFTGADYLNTNAMVFGTDTLPFAAVLSGEAPFIARYKYDHTTNIASFAGGTSQDPDICEEASDVSIDSLLAINFSNPGYSLTWSLITAPAHGTAVCGFTASSTGGTLVPAGLTYSPAPGYHGSDSFQVRASGCEPSIVAAITTIHVMVDTFPAAGTITGNDSVCAGHVITLSDPVSGGAWSSKNAKATITGTGMVTGVTTGADTIFYTVTNACGTKDTSIYIDVLPAIHCDENVKISSVTQAGISVYPNPTTGEMNIEWTNQQRGKANVIITDISGREVYRSIMRLNSNSGLAEIDLSGLKNGIYLIAIKSDNINYKGKVLKQE